MPRDTAGWGVGSFRLATIFGWLFTAGMFYSFHSDRLLIGALCATAAGGNFLKAFGRANGARLKAWEYRLEKLVRR